MFFARLKAYSLRKPKVEAFARGRYPQSLAYFNLWRASRHPQTLVSKIRYRLANDRRPLLTSLSDKYEVREYVRERIGEKYLTKLLGVWETGQTFNWKILPQEFVAKSTHGVGGSLIVWQGAAPREMNQPLDGDDWRIHLVNPNNFSVVAAERFCSKWVGQRFEKLLSLHPEWAYRKVPPRIIFEEMLVNSKGEIPVDIKFFCFDGICKFIEVDNDRFQNFTRDFFLPNWESVNAQILVPNSGQPIPRPRKLEEMIEIAEKLSSGIDFVTVDMYDLDDRIVFGEMSFYPGGGHEAFSPPSIDQWLGSLWKMPHEKQRIPFKKISI